MKKIDIRRKETILRFLYTMQSCDNLATEIEAPFDTPFGYIALFLTRIGWTMLDDAEIRVNGVKPLFSIPRLSSRCHEIYQRALEELNNLKKTNTVSPSDLWLIEECVTQCAHRIDLYGLSQPAVLYSPVPAKSVAEYVKSVSDYMLYMVDRYHGDADADLSLKAAMRSIALRAKSDLSILRCL